MIDEPISVVPYEPAWPERAAGEIARLGTILGPRVVGWEHIGSTSVPLCEAKPIVDLLVGVPTWPVPDDVRSLLSKAGYEDLGEAGVPGRLYFRKREPWAFNLAVARYGGTLWLENLAVRDLLRADPELREQYRLEKRAALAAGCTSLLAYSAHKARFMTALVTRAMRR